MSKYLKNEHDRLVWLKLKLDEAKESNTILKAFEIKVLEQEIDFLKKETKKYKPKKKDEKQEMTDLEKEELWLNEEIPEYNGCIKALLLLIF